MINILQVVWGLNVGGAETFLYNVLSKLETEKYHVDFVIQDEKIKNKKIYELCKQNKWDIYKVPPFNKNLYAYIKAMKKIMSHQYDVVHVHMNALINIIPVILAKKRNIKIIIHSHNSKNNLGGKIAEIIHLFNRKMLGRINTINLACSKPAGEWMYGDRDFILLDNAIDIEEYKYNEEERNLIRKKYGIQDKTVIGHVGRFVEAKNHEYILQVFKKYTHKNGDSVLMLVGDGPLKESIVNLADKLNISDKVIFTGEKQNTRGFYSTFDSMLFPSIYEGLPFVLVEAQASGLPVVVSNRVTKEIDLTANVQFLPLDSKMEDWVLALDKRLVPEERLKCAGKMKETKYNIDFTVDAVKKLYSAKNKDV